MLNLWLDGDSLPREVKDIIYRFALNRRVLAHIVANRPIPIPENHPYITQTITENTPSSVDDYIVDHSEKGDIIITRDIPLAKKLLEKKCTVINDRGVEFTLENISEKLSLRDFHYFLYSNNITQQNKKRSFNKRNSHAFSSTLNKCTDRLIRKGEKNG